MQKSWPWLISLAITACGDVIEPLPSGGTTSTSAPPECLLPADCPGLDTACRHRVCSGGVCGALNEALGTSAPEEAQIAGDCQRLVCDGQGRLVSAPDPADAPADESACTVDACDGITPTHLPASAGTPCMEQGGAVCDGAGSCVACLSDAACAPATACVAGFCAPPSCTDGAKNGGETDVDCGGPSCDGCLIGKACSAPSDCATLVCSSGACAAPTCADGAKNGDETDADCGGPLCPPCDAGKACFLGSDCLSGSCDPVAHACQ